MGKIKYYLLFFIVVCFSCEEVYHADIDNVEPVLVIEALVTNDADESFVRVSKTKGFYEEEAQEKVVGASIELVDEDGQTYTGVESGTGSFKFMQTPIIGKKYKLIVTAENETYESDFEEMPPVPSFDSLYVNADEITEYTYSSYGDLIAHAISGMRAYVDLPISDELSHYRFSISKTLEYIVPPPPLMPPPPTTYGWTNFREDGVFNIKGPAKYGSESILKKHSLVFSTNRINSFVTEDQLELEAYMVGWMVHMKEYGISEKAYNFYEAMNDQLEADGKLFDAIYAQLETNIHCVSNPEKVVVGFFELSSYKFTRFFMMLSFGSVTSHVHIVNEIHVIPPSDTFEAYKPPIFWEDRY